jgi:DnaJ-class molecular chaperone
MLDPDKTYEECTACDTTGTAEAYGSYYLCGHCQGLGYVEHACASPS